MFDAEGGIDKSGGSPSRVSRRADGGVAVAWLEAVGGGPPAPDASAKTAPELRASVCCVPEETFVAIAKPAFVMGVCSVGADEDTEARPASEPAPAPAPASAEAWRWSELRTLLSHASAREQAVLP